MRSFVVTGVSSGIGRAVVECLIGHGAQVFGSVRTAADADSIAGAIASDRFTPLQFDVTDQTAVQAAAADVRRHLNGATLSGLVANAGAAVPGPLLHLPLAEFRHQLEVNLVGQLGVIQAFAPVLGVDRSLNGPPGRIVTMSSVSGKLVRPFIGAYAASKHGLEALSAALRRELQLYGIDVIVIGPGAVVTPIWDKARPSANRYDDTDYGTAYRTFGQLALESGRTGLPAGRIADLTWTALTTVRPRTRYTAVRRWLSDWFLPRYLPARWIDRMVANRLGLNPLPPIARM